MTEKMSRWMVGGEMEKFEYHFVVIGSYFGRNGELTNICKIRVLNSTLKNNTQNLN